MRKSLSLLLILVFSYSTSLKASEKWFKLKRAEVLLDLPDKWAGYQEMIGLPLVVTGPKKDRSRLILSITPTSINKDNSLKINSYQYKTYIDGRKKWVESKGGSILSIHPYKKVDWNNVKNIHRAGYQYKLAKVHFEEFSYYFHCNKRLYHIKSLRRVKEFPKGGNTLDMLLQSFNCR